ncbi:MAG: hypothetical protein RR548_07350 [Carnobacterium sp.]|uniref:Uncharacterized protein n=1 Tax=Carnobacterium antarcticum TaxID=2126436 RepID=A0ABW4NU78_9LACT|nr:MULTISPECIES: hypothetical protein [unclassified Carnobacterium]ALV21224.1 hypothetical protein NY10_606 [Carnobacterium sp. CP1]QQP69251.1 hypothetical protein JHE06_06200 [Carnobacterium sp. CS13]
MNQATIEKVWQIKGLLFKNDDYPLALDLEDSENRVLMRYIIVDAHSSDYQNGLEIGYNAGEFQVYANKETAKKSLYSIA